MIEYCIVLSKEQAAKVAAKSDSADVVCDLEYLQGKVEEMIDSWGEELPCWL